MDSLAVCLQQVSYRWHPQQPQVLDIPELSISAGERVFLYGASGSGKSTLLNLLAGILRPQSGSVEVFGTDLTALRGAARDRFRAENIGVIYHQFNLLPSLSVAANIELAVHFGGGRGGAAGIDELLQQLALQPEIGARKAGDLSVGQQQRVAVARALVNRPRLLIADEPTSALDSDARDGFIRLLLDCAGKNNSTIIFVSHDKSLAGHFSRRLDISAVNRVDGRTNDRMDSRMGVVPCG